MTQANKETDEQLVHLVRSVDQELYIHLVKRYQKKLLRYAQYLTQDEELSQDAVQTTFIKAFKNLQSFNTNKTFSSWIYRITHNESMNILKSQRTKSLEPDQLKNLSDDTDIESTLEKKQLEQTLRKNLNQIPLKYRSVLTLHYLEEKKYEEISDILRLPMGTIATHINRGKKLLKRKLLKNS